MFGIALGLPLLPSVWAQKIKTNFITTQNKILGGTYPEEIITHEKITFSYFIFLLLLSICLKNKDLAIFGDREKLLQVSIEKLIFM